MAKGLNDLKTDREKEKTPDSIQGKRKRGKQRINPYRREVKMFIQVPKELHRQVKLDAVMKDITISQIVIEALLQAGYSLDEKKEEV